MIAVRRDEPRSRARFDRPARPVARGCDVRRGRRGSEGDTQCQNGRRRSICVSTREGAGRRKWLAEDRGQASSVEAAHDDELGSIGMERCRRPPAPEQRRPVLSRLLLRPCSIVHAICRSMSSKADINAFWQALATSVLAIAAACRLPAVVSTIRLGIFCELTFSACTSISTCLCLRVWYFTPIERLSPPATLERLRPSRRIQPRRAAAGDRRTPRLRGLVVIVQGLIVEKVLVPMLKARQQYRKRARSPRRVAL